VVGVRAEPGELDDLLAVVARAGRVDGARRDRDGDDADLGELEAERLPPERAVAAAKPVAPLLKEMVGHAVGDAVEGDQRAQVEAHPAPPADR